MEPKTSKSPESVVREIKRKTRRKFNSEEKITDHAHRTWFDEAPSKGALL
ncbi:hypothetical protein ACFL0M_12325 [Thermodesulfobacteriota bacterium]